MCDCTKNYSGDLESLGECPVCGSQFSTSLDLAKGMMEVLLSRQEACNAILLAAAAALEREGVDVTGVMSEANEIMVSLCEVDESLLCLIEFIEEKETSICENCLCNDCEDVDTCDGTNCKYDDEQVITKTEETEKTE